MTVGVSALRIWRLQRDIACGDRGKGWFYEPTVLADCRQEMEIVEKEMFSPVVPVVTSEDAPQKSARGIKPGQFGQQIAERRRRKYRADRAALFGKANSNHDQAPFHLSCRTTGRSRRAPSRVRATRCAALDRFISEFHPDQRSLVRMRLVSFCQSRVEDCRRQTQNKPPL